MNVKNLMERFKESTKIFSATLTTDLDANIEVPLDWTEFAEVSEKGKLLGRRVLGFDDDLIVACLWEKNAVMIPHRHPNAHENIFVIKGCLFDRATQKKITPESGVYHIQANRPHHIEAVEDTHFMIRFDKIKADSERY